MWRKKTGLSRAGSKSKVTRQRRPIDALEPRLLFSVITWTNRGQTNDGFSSVFGTNATLARSVIDAVIQTWERQIVNFNYPGGGNTYNITISMETSGTGVGAGTSVNTSASDGKPLSATMTIGRGTDGAGAGYFLDPTPLDSSEFTSYTTNAYAAYADASSPANGKGDLYELVLHEMGHAMGFNGSTDEAPLVTKTASIDTIDSGIAGVSPAVGNYYRFDGPDGHVLLTGFDSGGDTHPPSDFGVPVHFAPAGASVVANGVTYLGEDDLMTPYYTGNQRRLVSQDDLIVLKDSYGYTVQSANYYGTEYDTLDSDGDLRISGPAGGGNTVAVTQSGAQLTVTMTLGAPVPGADPTTLTSVFTASEVSEIDITGGPGNDTITLSGLTGGKQVNVSGNGSGGADLLTINNIGTGVLVNSSGVIGSNYLVGIVGIDKLIINGGSTGTTYFVSQQPASSGVTINGGTGNDAMVVNGAVLTTVPITFNGGGGTNSIDENNSALSVNLTFDMGDTGLVTDWPSHVRFDYYSGVSVFSIEGSAGTNSFSLGMGAGEKVSLTGGSANDSFDLHASVNQSSGNYTIAGGAGTDSLVVENTIDETDLSATSVIGQYISVDSITGIENLTVTSDVYANGIVFAVGALPVVTGGHVTLNGGGFDNTLYDGLGNLAAVGALTFNGEFQATVIVDNSDATSNWDYTLRDGSLVSSTSGFSKTDTFTGVTNVRFTPGSGNDIFFLFTAQTADHVSVTGGAGVDAFELENAEGTYALSGNGGNDVIQITDSTANNQTYNFSSTGFTGSMLSVTEYLVESLNLGTSNGTDTVNVAALPTIPVTIASGTGNDAINIGTAAHVIPDFSGGLTVTGNTGGGSAAVTLDDAGDTVATNTIITSTGVSITGLTPISWSALGSLTCNTSTQTGTQVNLISTSALTAYNFNCGSVATFNVGYGTLSGLGYNPLAVHPIAVNAPIRINVLANTDSTPHAYTLARGSIAISSLPPITYAPPASGPPYGVPVDVLAGTGNDTINIASASIASPLTVNGGAGNDSFFVGSTTPGTALGTVLSTPVTVTGGGGTDSLVINDLSSDAISVTSTYVAPLSGISLPYSQTFYSGFAGLTVNSGANGSITVASTAANTPVSLAASGGVEPITVSSTDRSAPVTVVANTGGIDPVVVGSNGPSALVYFATSQAIGTLNISSGGRAIVTQSTRKVLSVTALVLSGTGTIDLTKNDLIVQNGNLATVNSEVTSGYNQSGGANWNGAGITSSAAGGDSAHTSALATVLNNDGKGNALFSAGNLFDGATTSLTDVLVKFTYFGDANLDGKVDGSDYSLIDQGYQTNRRGNGVGSATGWYSGDFNYDKSIDGSDYALIDNSFNNQGIRLVTPAALVSGITPVPNPTAAAARHSSVFPAVATTSGRMPATPAQPNHRSGVGLVSGIPDIGPAVVSRSIVVGRIPLAGVFRGQLFAHRVSKSTPNDLGFVDGLA